MILNPSSATKTRKNSIQLLYSHNAQAQSWVLSRLLAFEWTNAHLANLKHCFFEWFCDLKPFKRKKNVNNLNSVMALCFCASHSLRTLQWLLFCILLHMNVQIHTNCAKTSCEYPLELSLTAPNLLAAVCLSFMLCCVQAGFWARKSRLQTTTSQLCSVQASHAKLPERKELW